MPKIQGVNHLVEMAAYHAWLGTMSPASTTAWRRSLGASFAGAADMTKTDLAARVADRVHLTKRQTEAIVSVLLACVTEALRQGDKVELRGFGSFRSRSRPARQGRNPRTGDAIQVPGKKVPFFKAGKALREKVRSLEGR